MSSSNFSLAIQEIEKLNEKIVELKGNYESVASSEIIFLSIEDVRKITGWSKHTVETLFNNPAFPSTDIGKTKLVLSFAFIDFFMKRRCKDEEMYW